ncbi:Nucleotidyl transferase of uncharacterised function (DUF1814) [Metamycoplasma arthritidis]|uniref:Nucleotidyl transferase AbiEii/AbiGii toxin family protein n=1 Tax=Metamycoplasma arthritidis (strain 158L3-1) TaxID=243272 RepID=B3PM22_META1|nr:nucleotidyl transferase AbiEii/AbiGii toxin family protein [Metamycoplasma arthritidis]ACF07074.1 conserved hypothetical protein [Metamycoplasma arthritidis 158L3-1]VEU78602.1 Nucleotidyl transferase of uncharacterised function (DUF1814) [Metamycoplasma arthritidis]
MNKLLGVSDEELELVIKNTANKLNMSKAIVEKDFWVCVILEYLFGQFKYKDDIVFKGGTSLSKVYKLIERFSEDIDLALDLKVLGHDKNSLYQTRSKNKQTKLNEELNNDTKLFIRDKLLPIFENDFKKILGNKTFSFYIDSSDEQTICFDYPKNHQDSSILQVIRLEIGCLAEPIPNQRHSIQTYIQDAYPQIFNEKIEVVALDSLRTFYEKLTILHKEANRTNDKYPKRYSRHYYDVYKMIIIDIRTKSFANMELLKDVVDFKKKFYACNFAKYDDIMSGNIRLTPPSKALEAFSEDYKNMQNMLFGVKIPFDQIIATINKYEKELNDFIKIFFASTHDSVMSY